MNTLQSMIEEAKQQGKTEINLLSTTYFLDYTWATPRKMHITNTTNESENPDVIKHFGVLLENLEDFTIQGNNAHIIFRGILTPFAILNCNNITIKDISFSFEHPSVTEMTVTRTSETSTDFSVHADCNYEIIDKSLFWYGENFRFSQGISQCYDAKEHRVWRQNKNIMELGQVWEETNIPRVIRANATLDLQPNQIIQMRDCMRTEVGIFINHSQNITLKNITTHFMHGLGIVGQYCENITMQHLNCIPDHGRTTAGFADFIQMSGCKGLIKISECRFSGAHDDVINVHGTHLSIISRDDDILTVRFMHHETYGIDIIESGDTLCAVDPNTLLRGKLATVMEVRRLSAREIELRLDTTEGFEVGQVIENFSCNPDVVIRDNYFEFIPTRGILVSTSGKVMIERNHFNRMTMSAILIADDAKSWYESGAVSDVTITKNTFEQCGEPVIMIHPENCEPAYVHSNITISENLFVCEAGTLVLSAKDVDHLNFIDNIVPKRCKADVINCRGIIIM